MKLSSIFPAILLSAFVAVSALAFVSCTDEPEAPESKAEAPPAEAPAAEKPAAEAPAEKKPAQAAPAPAEPKEEKPKAPAESKPAAKPEASKPKDKPAESKPAPAAPSDAPSASVAPENKPMKETEKAANANHEIATIGGGCFWCTEAVLERVDGVIDVVSGYMGGHVDNPTYEQIITKTTGHAEVIQVTFDNSQITFEELLDIFWQAHDPTTLNRQGNDRGPQYRSVIFYHTPEQKNLAEKSKAALDASGAYDDPAVTEITEASTFWEAEEYHQDYYVNNKDKNPYCRVVITPKMKKFGFE